MCVGKHWNWRTSRKNRVALTENWKMYLFDDVLITDDSTSQLYRKGFVCKHHVVSQWLFFFNRMVLHCLHTKTPKCGFLKTGCNTFSDNSTNFFVHLNNIPPAKNSEKDHWADGESRPHSACNDTRNQF